MPRLSWAGLVVNKVKKMSSCRVWPDGAFGLSHVERKFQMDMFKEPEEKTGHEIFIAKQIEVYGVEAVIEACVDTRKWRENLEGLTEENPPDNMDLTNVPNSLRAKRGQKGISRHGRLLVRNAAFLMERANALDTVSFLTTTLPPMGIEQNRYVVENWHRVVKNFNLRLTRKLQAEGLSGEIVGVTEVQEGRLSANADFIGLHLHLLFVGRKAFKSWAVSTSEVELFWKEALGSVSKRVEENCDFSRSTNMQRLKVSGAAYIGKYLSKGFKTVETLKTLNPEITLPACWYTCSLSLRHKVEKLQRTGDKVAKQIQDWIDRGKTEYFTAIQSVSITLDGDRELHIGWAGRLSERGRNALSLPFTPNGLPRQERLFPDGL